MFELQFCWKWNFHSSQISLRAYFRAVLISFSLSSVHFWIGSFLILGYRNMMIFGMFIVQCAVVFPICYACALQRGFIPCMLSVYADSWWIGCSHKCWLCWFCWFFMNWMFPHMLIMLIMLILDWLNGSSVQSLVPLLFCISTTPTSELDSKSNSCKLDWSKILSSKNIGTTKLPLDHFSFLL